MFDERLQPEVFKLADTSYGGENGFNQTIELSTEVLSNVKFIQKKKLIEQYFDKVSQDMQEKILLTPEQEKDKSYFTDKETGKEQEPIKIVPLLEWFVNNYKNFGTRMEIATDKSQERSPTCERIWWNWRYLAVPSRFPGSGIPRRGIF